MKRKKWSEVEEQTLLSKYADLLNSGTLAKLKTREKKFKPIADHVNSLHHLRDPLSFPFKWSWRDVSIKVQNMRHQYLGVKQKIRISENEFNWSDGEIHWENFLKYKEVFGDVELSDSGGPPKDSFDHSNGILMDSEEEEEEEEEDGMEEERRLKKGCRGRRMRIVGAKVLELREVMVRREEKRREREWCREKGVIEGDGARKEREMRREMRLREWEEGLCEKEMELEEMRVVWAKRELDRRVRLEKELGEERRRRMDLEEKWEEEEMEWRERMVEMQVEHEKQMMQMHADACQNQLQVLGVVARLVCQFFGSGNDGLGGGLGTLPPQVLQNLQHPGGLGDGGKPDAASPSEFL